MSCGLTVCFVLLLFVKTEGIHGFLGLKGLVGCSNWYKFWSLILIWFWHVTWEAMRIQLGQCLVEIRVIRLHRIASSQFTNLKPDLLREVWRPPVTNHWPAAVFSMYVKNWAWGYRLEASNGNLWRLIACYSKCAVMHIASAWSHGNSVGFEPWK